MKTRKNNRKRIVGGTNIRINTTTNTVNPSPPPSPSNILNISPKRRTPRRISNTMHFKNVYKRGRGPFCAAGRITA